MKAAIRFREIVRLKIKGFYKYDPNNFAFILLIYMAPFVRLIVMSSSRLLSTNHSLLSFTFRSLLDYLLRYTGLPRDDSLW